jgi:hypothetical protein
MRLENRKKVSKESMKAGIQKILFLPSWFPEIIPVSFG